jgi:hypothetical protein
MTGQHIYTLDIKNVLEGFDEPVKESHPNKICLEDYYYSIQPDFKNTTFRLDEYDEMFVESTVLHQMENNYRKVLESLICKDALTLKEAIFLSDFLIQIKLRNPYWLKEIISVNKDKWIDTALDSLYSEGFTNNGPYAHLPENLKKAIIVSAKDEQKNNPAFSKQMQLYGLIMRSGDHSERNEKYRTAIIDCQWQLLIAPENGPYFITSDNPGYGIKTDGLIYNSNFTGEFVYYLPVTKQYCLAISGFSKDHSYTKQEILKPVTRIQTDETHVIRINNYAMQRINSLLIASDKWYLPQIAKLNKPIKK